MLPLNWERTAKLRFSTTSTARIDVTDMANAQARLIANQELDKQASVHKSKWTKKNPLVSVSG